MYTDPPARYSYTSVFHHAIGFSKPVVSANDFCELGSATIHLPSSPHIRKEASAVRSHHPRKQFHSFVINRDLSLQIPIISLIIHCSLFPSLNYTMAAVSGRNTTPSLPPEIWDIIISNIPNSTKLQDLTYAWTECRHVSRRFKNQIEVHFGRLHLAKTFLNFDISMS